MALRRFNTKYTHGETVMVWPENPSAMEVLKCRP